MNQDYYDYCQQLLNNDTDYQLWLDVMRQENDGYKIMNEQPKPAIGQENER